MKKLLLASAVAALSVSAAQAAPTVYGKAYVAVDYEDIDYKSVGAKDKDSVQINSHASRIGFKGSEPITANTDVIYQLEYGIDIDGDDDRTFKARDTYLGLLNNSFGEFRFGRNQSSTDRVNNVITADSGYWDNLGSEHNMVDSGRIDNSVIWTAPKFSGVPLEFSAMYAADEDDNGSDGWGASLMFDQDNGFTVGVAYEDDLNLPDYGYTGDLIRGTVTFDLAKLMNNPGMPLTIGALYQQADFDYAGSKKEKGYVISANWALQNLSKPTDIYIQYNNTSDIRGINGKDSDQVVVGGRYYYKPNMIVHGYAGYNDSDIEFDSKEDVIQDRRSGTETLAVGAALEYKF
ncbi:porin [Psychrobacter lutiphocae]|uniref:porin n=1 Tax=Psychrobacter lutiphocae TaxID=540500 RepID=UPI000380FB4A|nr:porin [Psychrobacter lutiphocae]